MSIKSVIECAKDRFCCTVQEAGQTIEIRRLTSSSVPAGGTVAIDVYSTVYQGKAIVQKIDPNKTLIGTQIRERAHENVTHILDVFICPDDTDSFEKLDRLIYRGEEYEVETVEVEDPGDIIVYYNLRCVKVEPS